MRILVVDDEELIRSRLASILENTKLQPVEICATDNAVTAKELLMEKPFDMIITDIRMPKMTGVELAGWVEEKFADAKVILITGYSDFEYAKKAIACHVFEYILKPIDPEEIISVVMKARREIEKQEKQKRLYETFREYYANNYDKIRAQYLEELLFRPAPDTRYAEQQENLHIHPGRYRIIVIRCAGNLTGRSLAEEYYSTTLTNKFIKRSVPEVLTAIYGNLIFLFWEMEQEDVFEDNTQLTALAKKIRVFVRENMYGDVMIGVSPVSSGLSGVQNARKQAEEALEILKKSEKEFLLFYDDILEVDETARSIADELDQLIQSLRTSSREDARLALSSIAGHIGGRGPDYQVSVYQMITVNIGFLLHELKLPDYSIVRLTGSAPDIHGPDQENRHRGLCRWIELVCDEISSCYHYRSNSLVSRVMTYISTHYAENIGLADAARAVGRNPSYISRLIKENTDTTFVKLLTTKRVEEAKRLLKETEHRISDIAVMTGYPNTRYFNRVFKAVVNISPNDYRNFVATFGE